MRNHNRWRIKVGNLYLDLAEKFKKRETGILAELQNIRRMQNRAAEQEFVHSRFPNDITIKLKSFQFSEVFLLEDTINLKNGLLKLFPTISNNAAGKSVIDNITSQATDLMSSGWTKVGSIARKSEKHGLAGFASIGFAQIQGLPEEVEYITFSPQWG
jgi:hypothetical protein